MNIIEWRCLWTMNNGNWTVIIWSSWSLELEMEKETRIDYIERFVDGWTWISFISKIENFATSLRRSSNKIYIWNKRLSPTSEKISSSWSNDFIDVSLESRCVTRSAANISKHHERKRTFSHWNVAEICIKLHQRHITRITPWNISVFSRENKDWNFTVLFCSVNVCATEKALTRLASCWLLQLKRELKKKHLLLKNLSWILWWHSTAGWATTWRNLFKIDGRQCSPVTSYSRFM